MLSNSDYKNIFIDSFWLPRIQFYSVRICPRLRKNKHLKLLSITSSINISEVDKFIKARMMQKEEVRLCTPNHLIRYRIETEKGYNVLPACRYEQMIINNPDGISNHFPFGIMNLDFISQDPTSKEGRIETEIESIEATFKLQKKYQQDLPKGFILIYTTLIDDIDIQTYKIVEKLNSYPFFGWSGVNSINLPQVAKTLQEKKSIIQKFIKSMPCKYHYKLLGYDVKEKDKIHSVMIGVINSV